MTRDLDTLTERRAEFIYEVARLEAIASRRPIIPEAWPRRAEDFRTQFVQTIARLCADDAPPTTPEAEHDSWWRSYERMGWRYGPSRDPIAKTHPDMVPYDQLNELERQKDAVFLALCAFAKKYIRQDSEAMASADRLDETAAKFAEVWDEIAAHVHENALAHGFWPPEGRNDGEMIALMHSELSELLEAIRHSNPKSEHIPSFSAAEEELADVVIRLMDMAHARGWDVVRAVVTKMGFNANRPHKHGKTF